MDVHVRESRHEKTAGPVPHVCIAWHADIACQSTFRDSALALHDRLIGHDPSSFDVDDDDADVGHGDRPRSCGGGRTAMNSTTAWQEQCSRE